MITLIWQVWLNDKYGKCYRECHRFRLIKPDDYF